MMQIYFFTIMEQLRPRILSFVLAFNALAYGVQLIAVPVIGIIYHLRPLTVSKYFYSLVAQSTPISLLSHWLYYEQNASLPQVLILVASATVLTSLVALAALFGIWKMRRWGLYLHTILCLPYVGFLRTQMNGVIEFIPWAFLILASLPWIYISDMKPLWKEWKDNSQLDDIIIARRSKQRASDSTDELGIKNR